MGNIMIDIHTHILPQIDDGPSDWIESLNLIRQGIEDGIQGAVCTSHVLNRLDEELEGKLLYKFDQLRRIIEREKLTFDLWLGSEVHCNAQYNPFSKTATLNGNGRYILIEFPLGDIPVDVGEQFFQLTLDKITPILAHPERNASVFLKPELVYNFVQRGVMVQMNAGSITGVFGRQTRKLAFEMLDHNWVHFVASDCHHERSRPMILSHARKVVEKKWGAMKAETLFEINPRRAVFGEAITPPEPIPYERQTRKRSNIFRLRK